MNDDAVDGRFSSIDYSLQACPEDFRFLELARQSLELGELLVFLPACLQHLAAGKASKRGVLQNTISPSRRSGKKRRFGSDWCGSAPGVRWNTAHDVSLIALFLSDLSSVQLARVFNEHRNDEWRLPESPKDEDFGWWDDLFGQLRQFYVSAQGHGYGMLAITH